MRGDHRAAAAQALSISLGGPVDPNSCLDGGYSPLASRPVAVAMTDHSRRRFPPPMGSRRQRRRASSSVTPTRKHIDEEDPGRPIGAKLLMRDEARWIAVN